MQMNLTGGRRPVEIRHAGNSPAGKHLSNRGKANLLPNLTEGLPLLLSRFLTPVPSCP